MADNLLKVGNLEVKFNENQVEIGGKRYQSATVLLKLLFEKEPTESIITDADVENYREILRMSNALNKYYKEDGDLRSDNSMKYNKYLKNHLHLFTASPHSGLGLLRNMI